MQKTKKFKIIFHHDSYQLINSILTIHSKTYTYYTTGIEIKLYLKAILIFNIRRK